MLSKFEFISNRLELPLLNRNNEWITSPWVYCITGIIGAIIGVLLFGQVASSSEPISYILNMALVFVPAIWCGCTALAFFRVPVLKYALYRSLFNLVAVTVVFFVCAALSFIAIIVILAMIVLFFIGTMASAKSKSSDEERYLDTPYGRIKVSHDYAGGVVDEYGKRWEQQPNGEYVCRD